MIIGESPRRKTVSRLVSWGHWFAFYNILVALVIASIYVFATPLPDSPAGMAYLAMNWIGHISFVTFIGFIIFVIPLCYLISDSKFVKGLSAVIAAIGQALLAFDALLYNRTGLHLSLSQPELIVDETVQHTAALTMDKLFFFGLLFLVWLSFQLLIANAIWQRIDRFSRKRIEQSVIGLFLGCFVGAHGLHIWADAKLYQPIIQQDNMFPFSYPATAKTTLSRYGLLDLEDYQQRKSMQFTFSVDTLKYPTEPVYCPVRMDTPWLVIYVDEAISEEMFAERPVHSQTYYRPVTDLHSQLTTMTFGLPSLYHQYLGTTDPVLFELFMAFDIPVFMDAPADSYLLKRNISPFELASLTSVDPGVYFSLSTANALAMMLEQTQQQAFEFIVLSAPEDGKQLGKVYSSQPIASQIVLNEDIPSTLLHQFGCSVNASVYSTGQPIHQANRMWHVTTAESAIVMFDQTTMSIVESNGLSSVRSLSTEQAINQELNTALFNRSIKHLSQFSR